MCNYESSPMNTVSTATVIVWAFVLSVMITATTSVCAQQEVQKQTAERTYSEATRLRAEANSELAARKYEEAASQFRTAGDPAGEAKALARLAQLLQFSCGFQKSLSVSERLLSVSRASGDQAGERQATAHLCYMHTSVGDNERALGECNRALELGSK